MAEREYLNPGDRARFVFQRNGEFNAPYKYEKIVTFIVLFGGVDVFIGVTIFALNCLRVYIESLNMDNYLWGDPRLIGVLLAIVAIVITAILCILICGLTIKHLRSGFACTFYANDEKMVVNYGKDVSTVYFQDVDLVEFKQRTVLSKIRGYDVYIRASGKMNKFSVVADNYISERSTPFYIVKERMEMIQNSILPDMTKEEQNVALNRVSNPISREQVDRVQANKMTQHERLLAELDEITGNSSDFEPEIGALDESDFSDTVERADNGDVCASPYAGQFARGVEKHGGAMPDANGKISGMYENYTQVNFRDRNLDDIEKFGSFNCAPKGVARAATTVLMTVLIAVLAFIFGNALYYWLQAPTFTLYIMGAAMVLIWFVFFFTTLILQHGVHYEYRADGRAFFFTTSTGHEDKILYKDVMGVTYKRTKLLGRPYGVKVSIVTRYSTQSFYFMYPKYGHASSERHIPFNVIIERMPVDNDKNHS